MRQFASCDTRLEHSWGLRDSSTRRKRARQHRREREDLARRPNTHYGPSTWPCLYTTPPSMVIRGSRSHMPPDHFSPVWRLVFADRRVSGMLARVQGCRLGWRSRLKGPASSVSGPQALTLGDVVPPAGRRSGGNLPAPSRQSRDLLRDQARAKTLRCTRSASWDVG